MATRVAAVWLCLGIGTVAAAQQSDSGSGQPNFTPSLTIFGSLNSNPERVPGDTTRTGYVAAAGELPFRIRSPRWTFSLSYRPVYQYYRDEDELTTFDHSGSFALSGELSPRTRLDIEGDAYASNELRGLDATDVLLPRARQIRGAVDSVLRHRMSERDTLVVRAGYERQMFPDSQLVDSNSFHGAVGYSRAMSERVSLSLGGRTRMADFDNGRRSRSLSATAGAGFELGPNTDFDIDGGVLWIQQDDGSGWQAVEQPGFTVAAGLQHEIERLSLALRAGRDMGTTSGLGRATLRDRIVGSVAWNSNRLALAGLAGYSRNRAFVADQVAPNVIETMSLCGQSAFRVSRAVAVVGAVLYAHQLGEIIDSPTDTFRVSLGVRLQANGLPLQVPAYRYRFSSVVRSARATC